MSIISELTNATSALKDAHQHAYQTALNVHLAKRDLAAVEAHHTLAGLEGKNEAARKAELANRTQVEQTAVDNADYSNRRAQLDLTLAELDLRLARDLTALHIAQLGANNS